MSAPVKNPAMRGFFSSVGLREAQGLSTTRVSAGTRFLPVIIALTRSPRTRRSRAMTASTWTKMVTYSSLAKNSWISSMRWVPESGPYSVMIPLAAVPTRQVNSSSIIKDPKGL